MALSVDFFLYLVYVVIGTSYPAVASTAMDLSIRVDKLGIFLIFTYSNISVNGGPVKVLLRSVSLLAPSCNRLWTRPCSKVVSTN